MIDLFRCDCERGGSCSKISACRANSVAEEALDAQRRDFEEKLEELRERAEKAEHDDFREMVAQWMLANSFATGNGDTLTDLLAELTWQVDEIRRDATKYRHQYHD